MNNTIQNQKTLDEMIAYIAEEERLRQFLSNYEITEIDEICLFRRFRPPKPEEAGHLFQLKSAT